MSAPQVVVTLTKQAVNLGDHGQDIVTAVQALPGETVEDFAMRVLTSLAWGSSRARAEAGPRKVEDEWYLTLRLAPPAVTESGAVEIPAVILYLPGQPPRPERVVKAETVREVAEALFYDGDLDRRTEPAYAVLHEYADSIERVEP